MKIFVYGIDTQYAEILCRKFGTGEYVDVTVCYQDILALCADVVVINTDAASNEIISVIKEFERETRDVDDTAYYYVSNEELESWIREPNIACVCATDGKQVQI